VGFTLTLEFEGATDKDIAFKLQTEITQEKDLLNQRGWINRPAGSFL